MNFDPLARNYRRLEWLAFDESLQRARVRWLDETAARENALILGEGDGRFLRALLNANPRLHARVVDSSKRMLELASQRNRHLAARTTFIHADVRALKLPPSRHDLIVTNFVLDCFPPEQVKAIVAQLAASATAQALWMHADFQLPGAGWQRCHARLWLALLYRFFRVTTKIEANRLVSPESALRQEGFKLVARTNWRAGLLTSEWYRRESGFWNARSPDRSIERGGAG